MWNAVKWIGSRFWKGLDFTRRAIGNLILLLLLIGIGVLVFRSDTVRIEPKTALVIPISGKIVEQSALGSREAALAYAISGADPETRLRDVIRALDLAREDPRIESVLVRVEDLQSAGFASLREIGQAMDKVRATGKKVTVWSSSFSQRQYMIASHASEVFLHPMGGVLLTGIGDTRLYWGEALKNLGVTVHVFKAGAYKSFPETFVRNVPSEAALKADRFWMDDIWKQVTDSVERSRGLMPGAVSSLIRNFENEVRLAQGDMSRVALNANLVDAVRGADEVRVVLQDRQGLKKNESLRVVDYLDYLAATPVKESGEKGIAVVTLEGDIRDGASGMGQIGARSAVELIRQAKSDDHIAALVVRIDSPGGSAVASEMIRRELEGVRKSGKPVVVSMGDMAASGGYWISLAANKIVADPMTITGSVGVFGMMPTFEKTLDRFSVGTGGAYTEWLARAKSPALALDPRFEHIMEMTVERTYEDFLRLVSVARKMPIAKIEPLAQGRVYTGRQAFKFGLVDDLGGIEKAQREARRLAKLKASAPVYWYEESPNTVRNWVEKLLVAVKSAAPSAAGSVQTEVAERVLSPAQRLLSLVRSPVEPLAHCLVTP